MAVPKKSNNLRICPICGKANEKVLAVFWNNKYYCNSCYQTEKKRKEDKQALVRYICNIFDWDNPTALVMSQIAEFREEYGYSYLGMKSTLKYLLEVEEATLNPEAGIGLIPYFYDSARRFSDERKKLKECLEQGNTSLAEGQMIVINQEDRNKYYEYLKQLAHPEEEEIPIDELLSEEEKLLYLTQEELDAIEKGKGGTISD